MKNGVVLEITLPDEKEIDLDTMKAQVSHRYFEDAAPIEELSVDFETTGHDELWGSILQWAAKNFVGGNGAIMNIELY